MDFTDFLDYMQEYAPDWDNIINNFTGDYDPDFQASDLEDDDYDIKQIVPDTSITTRALVQVSSFGFGFDETKWNSEEYWEEYLLPYAWTDGFIPDIPLADLVTTIKKGVS